MSITIDLTLPRQFIETMRKGDPPLVPSDAQQVLAAVISAAKGLPTVAFLPTMPQPRPTHPNGVWITVRTYKGLDLPIEIHPELTILELKQKIAGILDTPQEDRYVLLRKDGKAMRDGSKTCGEEEIMRPGGVVMTRPRLFDDV